MIYTYTYYHRGKLHVRGITPEGERVIKTVDYEPTVWVNKDVSYSAFKDRIVSVDFNKYRRMMDDEGLVALRFDSIGSASKFISEVSPRDRENPGVFTSPRQMFESQYMCEEFPETFTVDSRQLRIFSLDIETEIGHRAVPDYTPVRIRRRADEGEQTEQTEQTMSIGEVEQNPERDKFELFDPDREVWCRYDEHPWRFVGGFPEPTEANEQISLITVDDVNANHIYTWGVTGFKNPRPEEITYFHCGTERELLENFVGWWRGNYPDILTGWNTSTFDIVYIIKRVGRVLGERFVKELSPFGAVELREKRVTADTTDTVGRFIGIACLDYLDLYKKFGFAGNKESYKLDDISRDELGIQKIPNPTGGGFREFYSGEFTVTTKPSPDDHKIRKLGWMRTQIRNGLREHPEWQSKYDSLNETIVRMCKQLFIEYNIRDVELVDKLDKKRKLIDLALSIACMAHMNWEDVFSPVKTWDHIIYNTQWRKGIIIPQHTNQTKTAQYEGAYVKPPLVGKHEYCSSFDLDSLYPHILMQYNIGPETLVRNPRDGKPVNIHVDLDKLIAKKEDTSEAHRAGLSMAASGFLYKKDKRSIIPLLSEEMYANRKRIKKLYLKYKSEHEKIVEELRRRGLETE